MAEVPPMTPSSAPAILSQRKQKTGPTGSNSVCLSSAASGARRRVGVLWGLRPESWLQGQWRPSYTQFVIRVASCFLAEDDADTPPLRHYANLTRRYRAGGGAGRNRSTPQTVAACVAFWRKRRGMACSSGLRAVRFRRNPVPKPCVDEGWPQVGANLMLCYGFSGLLPP
jgi:hypothetical protein